MLFRSKFQLIEGMAKQQYLDAYWEKKAKEQKISSDQARERYMQKHVKLTDKEVNETWEKYKDHPKLKELSKEEQRAQIREMLSRRGSQDILLAIISDGIKSGELAILYPRPTEPVYKVAITKDDHVRYGPRNQDVNPMPGGCKGDACELTVVEYSEFQCPFCSRVIPTVKRLLSEYKGKIRWIVRDFPLNFHDRARPAAVAAKCAGFQGKYWEMYELLFENQQKLSDSDLDSYAEKIKLDKKKYDKCVNSPTLAERMIDKNMNMGSAVGITGTPAFIINGRKLSGALPHDEFKRVFDEELVKIARSAKKNH